MGSKRAEKPLPTEKSKVPRRMQLVCGCLQIHFAQNVWQKTASPMHCEKAKRSPYWLLMISHTFTTIILSARIPSAQFRIQMKWADIADCVRSVENEIGAIWELKVCKLRQTLCTLNWRFCHAWWENWTWEAWEDKKLHNHYTTAATDSLTHTWWRCKV